MRYLLLCLFLVGCANVGPKGYVTNEQLRFRIEAYCQQRAYDSLRNGPPYHAGVTKDNCMHDFFYDVISEDMTRPEWRSK